jgi:hypothetical protein
VRVKAKEKVPVEERGREGEEVMMSRRAQLRK